MHRFTPFAHSLTRALALTPSLAAAKLPAYQKLIDVAVEFGKGKSR
jgi:hypothetical protein